MRLTNRTINLAKNEFLLSKINFKQSFFQSLFSVKKFSEKNNFALPTELIKALDMTLS